MIESPNRQLSRYTPLTPQNGGFKRFWPSYAGTENCVLLSAALRMGFIATTTSFLARGSIDLRNKPSWDAICLFVDKAERLAFEELVVVGPLCPRELVFRFLLPPEHFHMPGVGPRWTKLAQLQALARSGRGGSKPHAALLAVLISVREAGEVDLALLVVPNSHNRQRGQFIEFDPILRNSRLSQGAVVVVRAVSFVCSIRLALSVLALVALTLAVALPRSLSWLALAPGLGKPFATNELQLLVARSTTLICANRALARVRCDCRSIQLETALSLQAWQISSLSLAKLMTNHGFIGMLSSVYARARQKPSWSGLNWMSFLMPIRSLPCLACPVNNGASMARSSERKSR